MPDPNAYSSASLFRWPLRLLKASLAVVILLIGVLILNGFPSYFPARFDEGFLRLKESFFYRQGYFVGFYAHIVSAPIVLFVGAAQFSRTLRRRAPKVHMRLGQVYAGAALFAAAPGGLLMSLYAYGGWVSRSSFAAASILLWCYTFVAWRYAVTKDFRRHGRYMIRSYIMISSAVTLRLVHFVLIEVGVGQFAAYQWAAWLSWLPTLLVCEVLLLVVLRPRESKIRGAANF